MKLQSATRWESWYTRKYCYYVVKRSIIINGSAINTRCTVLCAFKLVNHHPKRNSLEKRPNRRWRSRSRVRGRLTRRGRVGFSRFHGRLATRARRSPAVHGAAPSARSAGPSHPRPGPYVRPTSRIHSQFTQGPCATHLRPLACLHPPRENPPNDRLHPTHDPGSSRSPDPRPSTIPSPARRLDYSWFGRRSPDGSSEASLSSRAPRHHFCAIIARHTCDLYRGHDCMHAPLSKRSSTTRSFTTRSRSTGRREGSHGPTANRAAA